MKVVELGLLHSLSVTVRVVHAKRAILYVSFALKIKTILYIDPNECKNRLPNDAKMAYMNHIKRAQRQRLVELAMARAIWTWATAENETTQHIDLTDYLSSR